jgi:hypothetical protein
MIPLYFCISFSSNANATLCNCKAIGETGDLWWCVCWSGGVRREPPT